MVSLLTVLAVALRLAAVRSVDRLALGCGWADPPGGPSPSNPWGVWHGAGCEAGARCCRVRPILSALALRGGGAGEGRSGARGWGAVGGVSKGTKRAGRSSHGDADRSASADEDDNGEAEDWGDDNVPVGKHLTPVMRTKKSETIAPAATLLSMEQAVARGRERRRERARSGEPDVDAAVRVTFDGRNETGSEGVLQITPKELRKLSKGALLKLAKESGLRVVCRDKSLLSNRDVRRALEPFLPSGTALEALELARNAAPAEPRKKGRLAPKSRYLSSVWVDGEERSVYGHGHPKDSDFLSWAVECVDELEAQERLDPSSAAPPRSKKERQQLIHETALRFSDQYFTMVLTGKVKPSADATISLPGVELASANAKEEEGDADVEEGGEVDAGVADKVRDLWGGDGGSEGEGEEAEKMGEGGEGAGDFAPHSEEEDAFRDKWDLIEQRDLSIYSVAQLNHRFHRILKSYPLG